MKRAIPSVSGSAITVAIRVATNDDRLTRPTCFTVKLYGGAEKIWEIVIEIPTSQEIQVVNSNVAQMTTGDASNLNGLRVIVIMLSLDL